MNHFAGRLPDSLRRAAALGIFVFSLLALWLTMDLNINLFDEGLVLVDAEMTHSGALIHRDFYTLYGPAPSYLLSALFGLTDHWFLAARVYGIAIMAGMVALVFGILAARISALMSLAGAALSLGLALTNSFYLYPLYACCLLALAGSALLLGDPQRPKAGSLLLAGCLTGLVALMRYDTGFFVMLGHAAFLALTCGSLRRIVQSLSIYAGGVALVFLPFAVHYLINDPAIWFLSDVVDYGIRYYERMRSLPFPRLALNHRSLAEAAVYLPVMGLAYAVVAYGLVRTPEPGRAPVFDAADRRFLLIFGLLAALLFGKGYVRISTVHVFPAIIMAAMVALLVAARIFESSRRRALAGGSGMVLLAVFALPVLAAMAVIAAGIVKGNRVTPLGQTLASAGLLQAPNADLTGDCEARPRTQSMVLAGDYWPIVRYVRQGSRPEEPVLVANMRHDRIFANSVGLYFLLDRPPATRWIQFDPGMQTRRDTQAGMIDALERKKVRWVIRDSSFEGFVEPNDSRFSSGVFLLDDFLKAQYRPVARSGRLEAWLLKSEPAPGAAFEVLAPCKSAMRS